MADAWHQPSNNPFQATQPVGGTQRPEEVTPIGLQVPLNLAYQVENMYFLGRQLHPKRVLTTDMKKAPSGRLLGHLGPSYSQPLPPPRFRSDLADDQVCLP